MMHTEEQAREKWCPHARTTYVGDSGAEQFPSNRYGTSDGTNFNPKDCRCIASDCMAWRWVPLKVTPEYLDAVRALAEETAEKAPFAKAARAIADKPEAHGLPSEPFCGGCGLAGKP